MIQIIPQSSLTEVLWYLHNLRWMLLHRKRRKRLMLLGEWIPYSRKSDLLQLQKSLEKLQKQPKKLNFQAKNSLKVPNSSLSLIRWSNFYSFQMRNIATKSWLPNSDNISKRLIIVIQLYFLIINRILHRPTESLQCSSLMCLESSENATIPRNIRAILIPSGRGILWVCMPSEIWASISILKMIRQFSLCSSKNLPSSKQSFLMQCRRELPLTRKLNSNIVM